MNELTSLVTDVDILINGKPAKKYAHKGKVYIEAREGTEYSIRVKNNLWDKKLVLASVDGINVLDGKAAGSTKAGYVLNGWNSYEIKGFRTSNEAVNAFKFSKKSKSYAAKSDETNGDTSNCGVIGVQFYSEKPPVQVIHNTILSNRGNIRGGQWNDYTYGGNTLGSSLGGGEMLARSCNNQEKISLNYLSVSEDVSVSDWADFDLGTEFSKKEIEDKVRDVEFEIGNLFSALEIYYASRESLVAMGVMEKETNIAFPKAFPTQFCKPPRD